MTNLLSVSSRMLLSLVMFLESFRGCFGTSSGTEGPSLVKLPVEESAVFVLFVLLHMFCSTRYALSSKFYKIYVINDKGNMRIADS